MLWKDNYIEVSALTNYLSLGFLLSSLCVWFKCLFTFLRVSALRKSDPLTRY